MNTHKHTRTHRSTQTNAFAKRENEWLQDYGTPLREARRREGERTEKKLRLNLIFSVLGFVFLKQQTG